MNGIPEGVELHVLDGRIVEQVAIGRYQIIIKLDDGCISIEGKYEIITDIDYCNGSADDPRTSTSLVRLIGLPIHSALILNRSTIEISFGEILLRIHDSNEDYESFRIVGTNIDITV